MVSFTTRFLFQFVDLAFAAKFEGTEAVAAIAYFVQFQILMMAVWVGLSAGFTAALADAFGRQDEARVASLKRSMLRLLFLVVPILVALGIGLYWLTPHLGLSPAMADDFQVYATIVFAGMGLTGFWSILPDSVVKAHHDTRSTMHAGLIASFTNVGLNTLFVVGFGWGLAGIAAATVVSRIPSLSYALYRARRLESQRRAQPWTAVAPTEATGKQGPLAAILLLAVPSAMTFGLGGVENAVILYILNRFSEDPVTAIAALGVFSQMLRLSLMPIQATGVAVVPYAASLLPQGAQGARTLWRELRTTLLRFCAASLVVTVVIGWIFPKSLAGFFVGLDPRRGTDQVSPEAIQALQWLPLAALSFAAFFMLRPVFEAAQRPSLGSRVAILQSLLFSVPLIVLSSWLAPALGMTRLQGIVVAMVIAGALGSITAYTMVRMLLRERIATTPTSSP